MPLIVALAIFNAYFRGMGNAAKNYKSLYEESLLTIAKKDESIEALNFELDKFRKYIFGQKNEKIRSSDLGVNQIGLFDLGTTRQEQEALSKGIAVEKPKNTEKPKPKKRAPGTGRTPLPDHLRREIITIEPEQDIDGCTRIGEEITEVLGLTPAEFYVKRYVRPKYARANGEGVIIGLLPDRIIEKGIPSEEVVAYMMVDKYVHGLPLHRQIDKCTRIGYQIKASSASDWMMKGWQFLIPIHELIRSIVLSQKYLQVDESPIKVLDKDHNNGIHKGYMWVYAAPSDQLVLYDYRKERDSSGPREMLKNFAGIIQTDGYSVYKSLFDDHPYILLAHCMAHARRKFVEARKDNKEKCDYVIARMQLLYALEQDMRDQSLDWEKRTALRQEKAVPVLKEIEKWLNEQVLIVRPSSPLGLAIAYARTRWAGLSAYAMHGQIEIDNNIVENSIRPLAIGRKNYLFAGSHDAAEMTAGMYTIMASCKRNGVNEFEYLTDVFKRIQSHKQKDLYQLLPNNWKKYKDQ